jgi:SAM-dependent methyltransferase
VQLGLVVDPGILFPPHYPYTSGTTKILRENFAELAREVAALYPLPKNALVVDIGSNDGTLLSNFHSAGFRVCGVEPTNAGEIARRNGITTLQAFFGPKAADQVRQEHGQANLITAANVFAHIERIHEVVGGILQLLAPDGIFISESHYLLSLVQTLQYDTIYHEHLRYYHLGSLRYLLAMHGLEVIHAKPIPTHGGSIRVYAARQGKFPVRPSVAEVLQREEKELIDKALEEFRRRMALSKSGLYEILAKIKKQGGRIYGIGAPSRASTLINYVGLDDGLLDAVMEIQGSYKIDKYIPGTLIPVLNEARLFEDQPEYALLLSWHIADELMPKLTARGYRGTYIIPLPEPRLVG